MSNVTGPRPDIKRQGNTKQYVITEFAGVNTRVMLDENVVDDWENISEMTFGLVPQTKKTGTQKDVDEGLIESSQIGELFDHNWDRLEVIGYKTFGREIAVKSHELKMTQLTSKMLKETSFEDVDAALEAAV